MKAELITHSGDDLMVVNAARVSFDKESQWFVKDWDGFAPKATRTDRTLSDKDTKLVNYLTKHNHFTPFTHCFITLRETVPVFVARQRFKHTVGFTYNEVSRRYVDDNPAFYFPQWRLKADNKKQGSGGDVDKRHQHEATCAYEEALSVCQECYVELIKSGIAPEQARMVLPQSMYTSYYVSGSLAAFARAYKLRIQPDAQVEIQELAKQWNDVIQPLYPVSWKALTEWNG